MRPFIQSLLFVVALVLLLLAINVKWVEPVSKALSV